MNRSSHYRTNSPPVVHETIGGETILVHLEKGTYYDLNASGGFIFESFVDGSTLDGVIDAVSAGFGASAAKIGAEVEAFASTLVEEELLVSADGRSPSAKAEGGPSQNGNGGWRTPALTKHTDMQELLVLDPVHEVDDAGWPTQA